MIAECAAFIAIVIAVAAPVCGHQNQAWPLRRQRHTPPAERRRVPSWAHTEPYDYEEAA